MINSTVIYTIGPEAYPTEIRSTGNGWTNAHLKIGAMIASPLIGGILELPGGLAISLVLIIITMIIPGVLVFILKETRTSITETIKD